MNDLDLKLEKLQDSIGKKRFDHSIRVYKTALKLNKKLNLNLSKEDIKLAGIFHDCAKYNEMMYFEKYKQKYNLDKEIIENKAVSHSFLGAIVAKEEYNISNRDVLDAIKYHTTGKENMSDLTKLILISDSIEPNRDYNGVDDLRDIAKKDLDLAVIMQLDSTIKFLIDKHSIIHLQTIKARNYIMKGYKWKS